MCISAIYSYLMATFLLIAPVDPGKSKIFQKEDKMEKTKSIETSIVIDANIETVWKVLIDFDDYKNWNPFIVNISGQPELHKKIRVTVNVNNKAQSFSPQIMVLENNVKLQWVGHLLFKGIFKGQHYFELYPINNGKTRFVHGENFSGILSRSILNKIKSDTEKGFESMNLALKQKVESL